MSPHDLLPIDRPMEDPNPPTEVDFYNNVVQPLTKDIIELEAHGIPINLDRVSKVEDTVNEVLENVQTILASNELVRAFLSHQDSQQRSSKIQELESKKRDYTSFVQAFNPKNKTHRTYVVNHYLTKNGYSDMLMDEWSIRDLKKLNQIIASAFIDNLIKNATQTFMNDTIDEAMIKLAQDKADIYNKNHILAKQEQMSNTAFVMVFNPGSSKQKQEFFEFYNIESESETKAGAPQWNRKELERLNNLLSIMINDKEHSNESDD